MFAANSKTQAATEPSNENGFNVSLSDDAVLALSEVRRIGEHLDDEHPMRYTVRSMRRTAESIISDAMRQATDISNQAAQLVKDYDESLKPQ